MQEKSDEAPAKGENAEKRKISLRTVLWLSVGMLLIALIGTYAVPNLQFNSAQVSIGGKELRGETIQRKIGDLPRISGEFTFFTPNVPPDPNGRTSVRVVLAAGRTRLGGDTIHATASDDGRRLTFTGYLPQVTTPNRGEVAIFLKDYRQKDARGGYKERLHFRHPIEFVR